MGDQVDMPQSHLTADVETGNRASTSEPFLQRMRRLFFPTEAELLQEDEARLAALDAGILRYPNAPSGYVLRGELYLNMGYTHLAVEDFQRVLALASQQQLMAEDWGFVTQAMRDRAVDGLNRAMRLRITNT